MHTFTTNDAHFGYLASSAASRDVNAIALGNAIHAGKKRGLEDCIGIEERFRQKCIVTPPSDSFAATTASTDSRVPLFQYIRSSVMVPLLADAASRADCTSEQDPKHDGLQVKVFRTRDNLAKVASPIKVCASSNFDTATPLTTTSPLVSVEDLVEQDNRNVLPPQLRVQHQNGSRSNAVVKTHTSNVNRMRQMDEFHSSAELHTGSMGASRSARSMVDIQQHHQQPKQQPKPKQGPPQPLRNIVHYHRINELKHESSSCAPHALLRGGVVKPQQLQLQLQSGRMRMLRRRKRRSSPWSPSNSTSSSPVVSPMVSPIVSPMVSPNNQNNSMRLSDSVLNDYKGCMQDYSKQRPDGATYGTTPALEVSWAAAVPPWLQETLVDSDMHMEAA
jgi:hypothetical protein